MSKKLLKTNELIEHCKKKGIKFNIYSEKDAYNYLSNNVYYFKLASYRFNYQKYKDGINKDKYINLDFAYLVDLFEIDNELKTIIFDMCLKIEQALKVDILKHVEMIKDEDGYNIMKEYELYNKRKNIDIYESFEKINSSAYTKCVVEKYKPNYPIWVYLEISTFGNLLKFCDYFKQNHEYNFEKELLYSIKNLRNACAHNNCLINDLEKKADGPNTKVKTILVKTNKFGNGSIDKKIRNQFIYGFICLMIFYNKMILAKTPNDETIEKLKSFFNVRVICHKEWYVNNNILVSSYRFLAKVIELYG